MELTEHLDELRDRLLIAIGALILAVLVIGVPFNGAVLRLIEKPVAELPDTDEKIPRVQVSSDGTLQVDDATRRLLADNARTAEVAARGGPPPALVGLNASQVELVFADGSVAVWGVDFRRQLFFFDPLEPFVLRIKIAVLLGIVAALPIIIWQIWAFIAPGLTPGERRFLRPLLQFGGLLFPVGAAFAYFMTSYALVFLYQYGKDFMPVISAKNYVNLTLMMMFLLGIVFECPVVMLALMRTGVVSADQLAANRPIVVTIIAIVSAVMTPPDPFTMLAMTLPLWLLFEVSLLLGRAFRVRAETPLEAAPEA